jgi:hypothetical protein
MLVLFDHGTPRGIARALQGHTVKEAKTQGWDTLPTWVTTNFDTFLEDTIFEEGISSGTDVILSRPIRNVDFAARVGGGRTLLKIHGTVTNSDPVGSIVITEEDYHRFLRSDRYIINKLYTLFCEKTVVFLGYSLNDPNVQFIYHEVLFDQKAYGSDDGAESFLQIRPSFFVSREAIREEQKAYYRHKRIQYIENCSIELFFQELTNAFDAFEKGRADVIARITASLPKYLRWYGLLDWNTDPGTINVPDEEKLVSMAEMLDIVELQEMYRATGATTTIADFDQGKLNLVVMGIAKVAESWCRNFLVIGRTDILEALLGFLQDRLRVRKSIILRSMIELIGNVLEGFPAVRDVDWFVQRYCRLLIQYDDPYNDWTDYTFSLEQYVRATAMFPLVSPLTRVRVIQGLYRQLSMCGRDRGDSWYTTNRVYSVWHRFNPAAWPLLEAEIKRYGGGYKSMQMLEHLKPGGDPTRFLPRE